MKLESECDRLCSQIVQLRDKGKCRLCSAPGIEPHHICRKGGAVRWYLPNLIYVCRKCHDHDNEVIMSWKVMAAIGFDKYDELVRMSHEVRQWKEFELRELKADFQEILNYYATMATEKSWSAT